MKQRNRLDNLFEKWDNEGSGYLELEEFETIAHKYKDGLEKQAINRGTTSHFPLCPASFLIFEIGLIITQSRLR